MKSIFIWGESNAGKTTTCQKLFRTLVAMQARVESYHSFEWGDFYTTLVFEDYRLAIYSAGDEKAHLQSAVDYGRKEGVDILVGVLSFRKHYSEVLQGMEEGRDFFWQHLPLAEDPADKDKNENHLMVTLLEKIYELLNVNLTGEPEE